VCGCPLLYPIQLSANPRQLFPAQHVQHAVSSDPAFPLPTGLSLGTGTFFAYRFFFRVRGKHVFLGGVVVRAARTESV